MKRLDNRVDEMDWLDDLLKKLDGLDWLEDLVNDFDFDLLQK